MQARRLAGELPGPAEQRLPAGCGRRGTAKTRCRGAEDGWSKQGGRGSHVAEAGGAAGTCAATPTTGRATPARYSAGGGGARGGAATQAAGRRPVGSLG